MNQESLNTIINDETPCEAMLPRVNLHVAVMRLDRIVTCSVNEEK